MAGDTIIIGNWNDATPAAPAGADNVKFQKDASSPPNISANVPRADTAGTKYGTIIYDGSGNANRYLGADGNWHDIPAGLLPEGGTPGQILSISDTSPSAPEWIDMPSGSLPSGGTTGQVLAKASAVDGDVGWVDQTSGGGNSYTPPVLTNFAWVNQLNAVAAQVGGVVTLTNAVDTGVKYNILVKSLPAAPITITAIMSPQLRMQNYNQIGICLRDSASGKLLIFIFGHDNGLGFQLDRYNSPTSLSATVLGTTKYAFLASPIGMRFRIVSGAPNVIYCEISLDAGSTWITLVSENYGTFLTPDQVGIHMLRYHNSGTVGGSLLSWQEA
jgi:hypothetical protein